MFNVRLSHTYANEFFDLPFNSHFTVPPNVTTGTPILGAVQESDRQIDCVVESYPASINYWIKESNFKLNQWDQNNLTMLQQRYRT